MIKAKANEKSINIPTCWSDITVRQYSEILNCTDNQNKLIGLLVGLSENEVERMDAGSLATIIQCCSFVQSDFSPTEWLCPKQLTIDGIEINPNIDIKTKTFGQKIAMQMSMNEKRINILDDVLTQIEIYFQPLLTGKNYDVDQSEKYKTIISKAISLTDAFAIQQNYAKQMFDILENERNGLSKKPTHEQLRAGISMFDEFGVMNIVDTLSGGDVLKYEHILNLEYNVIFLKLRKSHVESIFQENYRKILEQKNKT